MFPQLTPVTKNIVILCVVVYIASFIFPGLYPLLSAYYPFSPNFHSWQIITHMFMHAPINSGGIGITHILFNMLTLWSFGPVVEQILGPKKYTILYFVSGIGSFVLFNIWNFIEVQQLTTFLQEQGVNVAELYHMASFSYEGKMTVSAHSQEGINAAQSFFSALRNPMMGASGAIFGIVAAFATMFPDAKMYLMFIPVGIKAKYLLIAAVVFSVYLQFSGGMEGVAHMAHVGGALTGFLFARYWKNNRFRIN